MNNRFNSLKAGVLRNKFILFSVVFVLMIVQIFALFMVSERHKLGACDDEVNRELDRCVTNVDNLFENLTRVMISAKLDKEVITALSKPELTLVEAKQVNLQLSTYKTLISEIKNIYLYNSKQNIVYSTVSPLEPLDRFPFGKTREILQEGRLEGMSCIILDKADFGTEHYGRSSVFRLMMPCDHTTQDVIMADVDFDEMEDIFGAFESSMGAKVYIQSKEGDILYGAGGQEEPPMELLSVELEERQALRSYYGTKYLVTHKRSQQMDADIFSVIPEGNMQVDNFQARTLTMINVVIISVVLLFGALLTLFRYVRRIAKQNAEKVEMIKQNDIQESFLRKFEPITVCLHHPTAEEIEAGKQHIRELVPSVKNFEVALLRMDFVGVSDTPISLREKFNMIKQTEENLNCDFTAYAVYERENYVLFLLLEPDYDYVAKCRKLYRDCSEIFAAKNCEVYCYVSSMADFSKIHELYTEISNLSEYTFIYNRPMFLDFTILIQHSDEAELWIENGIASIRNNMITPTEDLWTQVDSFINNLRDVTPREAKQAVYTLYFVINQCVEQIRQEGSHNFGFDMLEYFPRISSLSSLDDAQDLFLELTENLQEQQTENDNNKYSLIVKRTREIVERRLADPMLCRSMIADEIGISKPYLGRIFKEVVGISLSDAINDMRLKVAEEQLVSTNRSIKDIIHDVGIVNQSYFTVLFKKKYGLSPSEYRDKRSN